MARNKVWTPSARALRYMERLANQAQRSAQLLEEAFASFDDAGFPRPAVTFRGNDVPMQFVDSANYYRRVTTKLGALAELAEDGTHPFTGEQLPPPFAGGNQGGAK